MIKINTKLISSLNYFSNINDADKVFKSIAFFLLLLKLSLSVFPVASNKNVTGFYWLLFSLMRTIVWVSEISVFFSSDIETNRVLSGKNHFQSAYVFLKSIYIQFFISKTFISNARLKLAEHHAELSKTVR